ncbi:NAD-dependent epimerase/dehydratase family protein [Thalassotalea fonticola]|uniref:NAD-dependent epimerase/dehydratase family protein n=1 Tax=Thalassotalea fonticola TaxID=3065649 RepID=A0ABZ0GJU2_9GAMM|nr:NAD-dependent epimerase/dehydratase family protein [Colwelliaceae bacterium S1-1]
MRVIVIGATGHIGSFLIPKLVNAGFEVFAVSRHANTPYKTNPAWRSVKSISLDREKLEQTGEFGNEIAQLNPDIVIDLICFTQESAQQLVNAIRGKVRQLLHCGSIWVHGNTRFVPSTEEQQKFPLGDYGINKAAIESYLIDEYIYQGFPATIVHPGHIVGPGWCPLNPAGNFNEQFFIDIEEGNEVLLPNLGLETLHHVHADDVAQVFMQAILHRNNALGESFHAVSNQALTLRGYTQAIADWLSKPVNIRYLPLAELKNTVSEDDYNATVEHISHNSNCSNLKARQLLNYNPRYSSIEAIQESLIEMIKF